MEHRTNTTGHILIIYPHTQDILTMVWPPRSSSSYHAMVRQQECNKEACFGTPGFRWLGGEYSIVQLHLLCVTVALLPHCSSALLHRASLVHDSVKHGVNC